MTPVTTRTVLIVEDAELCHDALEVALMKIPGLGVHTVSTAEEALGMLEAEGDTICAVVTDLHLPLMDGFALIQTIRANPRRSSLPILVISGDSDPRTPQRLATLGASAYFPKPYSPAEVRSRLERLIDVP